MNDIRPSMSFEFFPPKSPEMEDTLWDTVCALAPLDPAFVSVTYGAVGSSSERTHATVAQYFGVGKIEHDQLEDYARRKGMDLVEMERWLAPNLNYDPACYSGRDAAD